MALPHPASVIQRIYLVDNIINSIIVNGTSSTKINQYTFAPIFLQYFP